MHVRLEFKVYSTILVLRLHPQSQVVVIDHKFPGYHVLSIHITLTVTYIKWFCVRKLCCTSCQACANYMTFGLSI